MAILVGGGAVACATTVEGNGSIAAGVVTSSPTPSPSDTGPSSDSPSPTDSATPTETSSSPTPSPSTNPVVVRQRVLCVLEQASITSINNQFNKTKDRAAQVRVLGTGVTTIKGPPQPLRAAGRRPDPQVRAGRAEPARQRSQGRHRRRQPEHDAVQQGHPALPDGLHHDLLSAGAGNRARRGGPTTLSLRGPAYLRADLGMCGLPARTTGRQS